jgi:hypothetical protein
MKVQTVRPPVKEEFVVPQEVLCHNYAKLSIKRQSNSGVVVGVSGCEPDAALFSASACDEAAAFFTNLARVLRGEPQS